MTPNLYDLEYFLEVAHSRNISRASERLGITQPSLSAAMKRLEAVLGVSLFTRSRTGVQLTKAGEEFAGKAKQLLSHWDQIKSDVSKRQSEVSGRYVIGCHPSVALYSLEKFVPSLIERYPGLSLEFTHNLSRKITEAVIRHEVDFGIVVNPIRHPDLVIRELCKDEVGFWTSKKPSILQKEKSVLICDPSLIQSQRLLDALKKKGNPFKRMVPSGNLEVIASLAASGAGVGVLPKRVALRDSALALKPLGAGWPIFKDQICLVYRADAQKTKTSQVLVEAMKAAIS